MEVIVYIKSGFLFGSFDVDQKSSRVLLLKKVPLG